MNNEEKLKNELEPMREIEEALTKYKRNMMTYDEELAQSDDFKKGAEYGRYKTLQYLFDKYHKH